VTTYPDDREGIRQACSYIGPVRFDTGGHWPAPGVVAQTFS
jgi:hypothetical protein